MNVSIDRRREIVVPDVGTLIVDPASGARVDRAPGAVPAQVDGLLRGSGRALHLQLQEVLPLHVSAVVRAGFALGLVGAPGAGKSSIAAAMTGRGWRYVSDDIAALTWSDSGTPQLEPEPAMVTLWGGSARELGWDADEAHRILPGADKFAYERPHLFVAEPSPLRAIYIVDPRPATTSEFSTLGGKERFDALMHGATYNSDLIDTPAGRAWHFDEIVRLAQRVPVFRFRWMPQTSLRARAAAVERHCMRLR